MKIRLVLIAMLVLLGPMYVFAASSREEAVGTMVASLAAFGLTILTLILKKLGKGTGIVSQIQSKLQINMTQRQIDAAVEYALKDKVSPALADIIGDFVSSVYQGIRDCTNGGVLDTVKSIVSALKGYSPDMLSKIFSSVSINWDNLSQKKRFLDRVGESAIFQKEVSASLLAKMGDSQITQIPAGQLGEGLEE